MRTTKRLGTAVIGSAVLTISLAGSALAQDVEGFVDISGSSTVEPISLIMAEEFNYPTAKPTSVTPHAPSRTPRSRTVLPTASNRSS